MSDIAWLDILGWKEEDLQDLRFVGYSYLQQGHYETALKFYQALVILAPDSAYDKQTIGAIHLEMGDNLQALNYLDRALTLDPRHEETLLNKARALVLLGYIDRGLTLAKNLTKTRKTSIKNSAEALLLAYR